MPRHWLFDWSGTLADDLAAVIAASNHVLASFGAKTVSRQEFRETFRLPFSTFYEDRIPHAKLDEIQKIYLSSFTEDDMPVTLLPGALDLLTRLKARGDSVQVVSSAPLLHVEAQAKNLGVSPWLDQIHGGVMDKPAYTARLIREHSWAKENSVFVGDMTHDIQAGKENGMLTVALLTGYETAASLTAAEPDILACDLPALLRLLPS